MHKRINYFELLHVFLMEGNDGNDGNDGKDGKDTFRAILLPLLHSRYFFLSNYRSHQNPNHFNEHFLRLIIFGLVILSIHALKKNPLR